MIDGQTPPAMTLISQVQVLGVDYKPKNGKGYEVPNGSHPTIQFDPKLKIFQVVIKEAEK